MRARIIFTGPPFNLQKYVNKFCWLFFLGMGVFSLPRNQHKKGAFLQNLGLAKPKFSKRAKFYTLGLNQKWTVHNFIVCLHRQIPKCNFGDAPTVNICDELVADQNSDQIQHPNNQSWVWIARSFSIHQQSCAQLCDSPDNPIPRHSSYTNLLDTRQVQVLWILHLRRK